MNLVCRDIYYNKICSSVLIGKRLRTMLYKWGGVQLGKNVTICPHCFMGDKNIKIGEGTFVNYNVWFNSAGGIEIGARCNIAYGVSFITSTHKIGNDRRAGTPIERGIKVGDGTWIGANSSILPGVVIGKGVIVGAGTVITKDCEDNCIYAGNPARLIRRLEN